MDYYTANFGTPTVWQQTAGDNYNRVAPRMLQGFLTTDQVIAMERVRQARMLYQGLHRDYFLGEGRTQHDFPPSEINGRTVQLYVGFNLLRLISRKHADLMFGQEPLIKIDDEDRQKSLQQFIERSRLHVRMYSAACSTSWAGVAYVESVLIGGLAYVQPIPADQLLPIGVMQPDGQYAQYVRYRVNNFGTDKEPSWALLTETHSPGKIERRADALDNSGKRAGDFDLAKWPVPAGSPALSPATHTGISRNTITMLVNEDDEGVSCSDYDGGLIVLQDSLNSKQTQIARVLAKHADPKLALPNDASQTDGQVASSMNVYYFNSREEIPQYIVWNAELQSAIEDRKQTVNALCITAEMSQVLLGLKEGSAPDAARKLRLEATNALAKSQRKAAVFKPAVRRVVSVSMELEANLTYAGVDTAGVSVLVPGGRSSLVGDGDDIGVEMRDGLPQDELDEAQIVQTYRASGTMSVRNAIERRIPDRAAAEAEYREVTAEAAANVPSIVMGEPGETPVEPSAPKPDA